MSENLIGPIVTDEAIKKELTKRRSPNIFNTITAKNVSLVKKKAALEEQEGWFIAKKNVKSYRLAQRKPSDELLEDEVWCLIAQMGFKELSSGRNFHISVGKTVPPRQVDVFGKDNETAVVIECTQSDSPKVKSMVPLIERLVAMRKEAYKSISSHYGRDRKLKVKMAIATRNITWRDVDIEKCKEANIAIITDDELDYYKSLVQYLKQASRYQFLAHLFEGSKIDGLEKQVAATQGIMGGVKFYNFLIRPEELLKIAYIGHKSSRNIDSIETYQRMVQPARLRKIAKYIEEGGKFPTNIVVNIKTNARKGLRFDAKEKVGNESFGTLYLPKNYASAWVIDGQHRLYGYAYAAMNNPDYVEKSTLPVLAFENLGPAEEMNMFIDINSKQVKVQKGLLVELYADLHWNSPDVEERQLALLSRIVSKLNSSVTSPIRDRVKVTGKKASSYRCLTQTSLSDGLVKSRLLGWMHKGNLIVGPLASSSKEKSLNKATVILAACLQEFATDVPKNWALGDALGGYLCTNIAIRAIFHLIKDICDHVEKKSGHHLCQFTAEEVIEDIKPYLKPVVSYFETANEQQFLSFRRIGSSLSLVKQQSRGMGAYVHKVFPDFSPPGLIEYLESRDEAGTELAATRVRQINDRLFKYVVDALKQEFGEKDWYTKGVSKSIRDKTMKTWNDDDRKEEEHRYLNLINYQTIAMDNWNLMKDVFALGERDIGNRKLCVKWIKDLNEIRKITAHPEKGALSTDQTRLVAELDEKVKKHFG